MNAIIEAIKTFGKDSQCKIAIEEMAELTKEICKNFRGEENVNQIAEEIADVKIMLAQLEFLFCCSDKVNKWIDIKLRRLDKMIQREKGENNDG